MTRKEYLKKLIQTTRNKTKDKQTANASKYPQGFFKRKPVGIVVMSLSLRHLVNYTVVKPVENMELQKPTTEEYMG